MKFFYPNCVKISKTKVKQVEFVLDLSHTLITVITIYFISFILHHIYFTHFKYAFTKLLYYILHI